MNNSTKTLYIKSKCQETFYVRVEEIGEHRIVWRKFGHIVSREVVYLYNRRRDGKLVDKISQGIKTFDLRTDIRSAKRMFGRDKKSYGHPDDQFDWSYQIPICCDPTPFGLRSATCTGYI